MANLSRQIEAIFTITFVNLLPFHKFIMNVKLSRDSQVEYMLLQNKYRLSLLVIWITRFKVDSRVSFLARIASKFALFLSNL